jgi:RNA polymerase sigma factor (TIGR02999 family)
MAGERGGHTLQATALVNEAYLKLKDQRGAHWQNRAQFFAVAAQMMRHILVDYARRNTRAKRGGGAQQVTLDEAMLVSKDNADQLLAIDDALRKLEAFDSRKSQVATMRFFAGLSVEETAEALAISVETVGRDWRMARAWLRTELSAAA